MKNQSTETFYQSETDWLDLRSIFYDILEYKWIFLSTIFFTLATGFFYLSLKVPKYQANILLQINNNQQNHLNMIKTMNSQLSFYPKINDPASIQSALIRSRFILDPVIDSLKLNISVSPCRVPFISKIIPRQHGNIHVSHFHVPPEYKNTKLNFLVDNPDHFKLFDQNHRLLLQGKTGKLIKTPDNAFSIQVDSENASVGERFFITKHSNQTIINHLIRRLKITDLGFTLNGAASKTGILQISLIDTDPKKLVAILDKIALITQQKDLEKQSMEAEKMLSFLNQQLPVVRLSLESAEKNLNHYRAASGKIDIKLQIQFLLNRLTEMDKQIESVRLNKMDMTQKYTEKHPFIIAVNQKLKELNTERRHLQRQIQKMPASDQVAINLMRDVKVKTDLYLILMTKIQELNVVKAGTLSDVRILSSATLPNKPIPMGRSLIIVASLVMGLMLGFLFVVLRKFMTQHIEDPNWIESKMNIVNLAIIPYSKQQAHNQKAGARKSLSLLASKSPHDLSIESLRSLRTSLQIMQGKNDNNVISIIGICPGAGKTFISANFSWLLADIEKRVLLIDGDLRRGHLQNYFSVPRAPGLTELINGTVTSEKAITQHSMHSNLYFLPTGSLPFNPSELIMSKKFKMLVRSLSQQYDLVVIDTAPVLAVTDGVLLGSLSDINFLVIGSKLHRPQEIQVAIKQLSNAGVTLHGYIFNHLKPESVVYGKGKYGYYYTYTNKTS